MMRSLFSGVAGLKAHQTKMDVIGNNISNVNTYGYKSSRTTFRDVYYQTLSASSNASGSKGGKNATQIGYGAAVGSIDVLNTRSGFGSTGRSMDCYIDGEGYFVVRDGAGNERLTQVGTMDFDSDGNLVDGGGNFVCGYKVKGTTEKASVGGALIDFGEANQSLMDGYTIEVKYGNAGSAPIVAANSISKAITVTLPSDAPTTANMQSALSGLGMDSNWTGTKPAGFKPNAISVSSQNTVVADTTKAVSVKSYDTTTNVGGSTIDFGVGNSNALEGYSVVLNYGSATKLAANSNTKTITVTLPSDAPTAANLQAALAGIASTDNWTGTIPSGVTATGITCTKAPVPASANTPIVSTDVTPAGSKVYGATVGGIKVNFGTGTSSALNGYNIIINSVSAGAASVKCDSTGAPKTITVDLTAAAHTGADLKAVLAGVTNSANWTGTMPTGLTAGDIDPADVAKTVTTDTQTIGDVTPATSKVWSTKVPVSGAIIDFGSSNKNLLNGYDIDIVHGANGSTPTLAANSTTKKITVTIPADGATAENVQKALADLATPAKWTGTMPTNLTATGVTATDAVAAAASAPATSTLLSVNTKTTVGGAIVDFGAANTDLLDGYSIQVAYGAPGSTPALAANALVKSITISIPSDAPTAENMQKALSGIGDSGNWTGTMPVGLTAVGVIGAGKVNATTGKAAEAAIFDTSAPTKITNKLKLKDIGIGPDGSITGENEAGKIVTIGQIAIANVPNPAALTEDGNSYFKAVNNTGEITYHAPSTGNVGALSTGGLEMSNVDLATEFSDMIIAQRGFQANSKIITVADTMLEELVNLKR